MDKVMKNESKSLYNLNQRIEKFLGELTLEEKVDLTYGRDTRHSNGVPRLGLREVTLYDGPNGLHLGYHTVRKGDSPTALPCTLAVAASFSRETGEKMGTVYGLDSRAAGVDVLEGPGVNLMRTPLCGRNFEYMGEEPYLTGKVAAAIVRACQALGVAACPKHLALNNTEICRTTGSSDVDERTIRELYMAAFELIVKEAGPWVIMSSYNCLWGQQASECGFLQNQLPKEEWGFDGVMLSDWGGAHDAVACAGGGLDLAMPGSANPYRGHLIRAVRAGSVPESVLDEKVRRVLRLMLRVGSDEKRITQGELGGEAQRTLALEIARDSMVLLKNEGEMLPLASSKVRRLAVVGPNAQSRQHRGMLPLRGASGATFTEREITPLEGIRRLAQEEGIAVDYYPVAQFRCERPFKPSLLAEEKGMLCQIYSTRQAYEHGETPLSSRQTDGVHLLWPTGLEAAEEADWTIDEQNAQPCFFLLKGSLVVPKGRRGRLLVLGILGGMTVRLDGKVFYDGTSQTTSACELPLPDDGAPHRLEVLFDASVEAISGLELHWLEDEEEQIASMLQGIGQADAVVYVGGSHHLHDKECIGWGYMQEADLPDLALPEEQDALISRIAAANPNTAVVLFGGTPLDVEPWLERVPALVEAWYPGEQGGVAIAELLFGRCEAAGRLPFTWARRLGDYAPHALGAYPGSVTATVPHLEYTEGLLMGYRWFEKKGIEPRYPFGFGLSYTSFRRELLSADVLDSDSETPRVQVRVRVTDIGNRRGADVVQLYIGNDELASDATRPQRELRDFQKVWLEPGQTSEIVFEIGWRELAHWHPVDKRWKVLPGKYRLDVATSASPRDVFATAEVELLPPSMPKWLPAEGYQQV